MNNIGKFLLGALLLGVAAAGYWVGAQARTEAHASAAKSERRVLYYRNPMGLPDTSPVPKKDAMGMDYVAVYEGDAEAGSQLNISVEKMQKLGVKSEPAALRELDTILRVAGRIEIDERSSYTIAPKFEGWVEHLYVNATGQTVSKGQPLFDVYSPELVSAQREHALALQGLAAMKDADAEAQASMRRLADASAARLQNWNIADATGDTDKSSRVTFRAPVNGIVLEKKAVQGMRFMPGEMLYQIADLSSVWVIADVPEQDIAQVQTGSRAQVTVDAYPQRNFDGRVEFVYPTLNAATRTVQVRIAIANSSGLLKPAMFASVQLASETKGRVLAVPTSAVIDSGTRQVVLVRLAEGRFEPREVRLGKRGGDYAEVLNGVAEGEQVVTSANFLIDAESNLKAALAGMSGKTAPLPVAKMPVAEDRAAHAVPELAKKKTVGHQARGVLQGINADGTLSITHEAIESLGWPGMTMDFSLANAALAAGIQPGNAITFELVERKPDEWVIVKLQAVQQGHAQHQHEGH